MSVTSLHLIETRFSFSNVRHELQRLVSVYSPGIKYRPWGGNQEQNASIHWNRTPLTLSISYHQWWHVFFRPG